MKPIHPIASMAILTVLLAAATAAGAGAKPKPTSKTAPLPPSASLPPPGPRPAPTAAAAASTAGAPVIPAIAASPGEPFRVVCPNCHAELAVTPPETGGAQGKASLLAPPPADQGASHAGTNSGGPIAPGNRPEPVLDGRIVRSKTSGYSVTLPSGDWTLHSRKDSPIGNQDADAEMSSQSGGFAIVIAEDGAMNTSTYARLCLERTGSAIQEFLIGARKNRRIGGMEAVQATASGTINGLKIRYFFTFLCGKQHCYQIVCWTATNLFDDLSKDFHTLADSFSEVK